MTSRRSFIKKSVYSSLAMSLPIGLNSCNMESTHAAPKISLAQWSLNRAIRAGSVKAEDFAAITKNTYGIDAVEYVAGFYSQHKTDAAYWTDMLRRSEDVGVNSLLIMIDEEGDLGDADDQKRGEAVKNHHAWIDAAKTMKCHSIRVNAFGAESKDEIKAALVDGLGQLCEYGGQAGINVLIENHGLYSSQADFIVEVIKEVNSPYMGTLPDFGNWCTSEKWGGTRDDSCGTVYDHVQGVKDFMPFAKGVSAKTYDFDTEGGQPRLDYSKIMKVVKDAGYDGYIGIEYEGENLSEPDGIRATKALIEKVWAELD